LIVVKFVVVNIVEQTVNNIYFDISHQIKINLDNIICINVLLMFVTVESFDGTLNF